MVASERGGCPVLGSAYRWQFEQTQRGRGILVFDGWHKLGSARWLFGRVAAVRAWIGSTEPSWCLASRPMPPPRSSGSTPTVCGGLGRHRRRRHVPAVGLRHERRAVGGDRHPRLRPGQPVHRRGIQQPSLEVFADGELLSYHALDDHWASSFEASGRHWLRWLRTGEGLPWWRAQRRSTCCVSRLPPTSASAPTVPGSTLRPSPTDVARDDRPDRTVSARGDAPTPSLALAGRALGDD